MATQAHLITATTALAIGIAGTLAAEGIVSAATFQQEYTKSYQVEITGAAKTGLVNWLEANICPAVDADLTLTGGDTCVAGDFNSVAISQRSTGEVYAGAEWVRTVSITPQAPQ